MQHDQLFIIDRKQVLIYEYLNENDFMEIAVIDDKYVESWKDNLKDVWEPQRLFVHPSYANVLIVNLPQTLVVISFETVPMFLSTIKEDFEGVMEYFGALTPLSLLIVTSDSEVVEYSLQNLKSPLKL